MPSLSKNSKQGSAVLLKFSWLFWALPSRCYDSTLKICHYHFLPHSSWFIIHNQPTLPHSNLDSIIGWEDVLHMFRRICEVTKPNNGLLSNIYSSTNKAVRNLMLYLVDVYSTGKLNRTQVPSHNQFSQFSSEGK